MNNVIILFGISDALRCQTEDKFFIQYNEIKQNLTFIPPNLLHNK